MARVYNFSAGPGTLPEPVLRRAAAEMLEYGVSGQSVMEMSHRSREYEEIIHGCEKLLRQILSIPDNYQVLFLQGGAWTQFSMVPLNLLTGSGRADYVVSGQWAKKACDEASRYGKVSVVASSADENFSYVPRIDPARCDPGADYLHICYNNTLYGTAFSGIPDCGAVPLVADMSSCILSGPLDISKFGLIYAGAQKNMGPAGVCVVIVREDLIGRAMERTPSMLNYKIHADAESMFNTPPTYAVYIVGLVLKWLRDEVGGLEKMLERNRKKAAVLYDYLDGSRLFRPTARKDSRSLMNVTFVTGSDALDKEFVAAADKAGFVNLKGHRAVGGMRASIYNAMPLEGVEALVGFMREFEAAH